MGAGGRVILVSATVVVAGIVAASQLPGVADVATAPIASAPATQPYAIATAAVWKPLAIGGGGFLVGINLHPNGLDRVVRADTYGAWIWRASRWAQLVTAASMPPDTPRATGGGAVDVVFAPSNRARLYLFYNRNIYRSDDRGLTFQATGFAPVEADPNDRYREGSYKLAVDPANADIVLAGTRDDGLWRSTDAGASWSRVGAIPVGRHSYDSQGRLSDAGAGISVFFDPRTRSGSRTLTVYAASWQNGIWRSTDGGANWVKIAGDGDTPGYAYRSDVASDGTVFVTDKETRVWRYRNNIWTDISIGNAYVHTVLVDPTNAQRLYAFGGDGQPYRSLDAGTTWTKLTAPSRLTSTGDVPWLSWTDNDFFTTGDVRFDPKVPGRLWIAQGFGVWKADVTDATTQISWASESRGIEQLVINDIAVPPGGKPVVAAWDQGLFYKSSLNTFPATRGPTRRFNSVWQVDWSASNPRFMVQNASDHRGYCCTYDGLSIQAGWSEDGGQTWTRFATLPNPPGTDPNDVFRHAFGDIAVAANDVNNIIWVPTRDGPPAITRDRGASWSFFEFPNRPGSESRGLHYQLYLNRKILASDKVLPNTFYLVSTSTGANYSLGAAAGTWRTTDGGRSWSQVSQGFITDYPVFNAKLKAVPGRAGHLFFTPGKLDGDPDIPLMRTTDGGAHWVPVPGASRIAAVGFGRAKVTGGYPTIFIAGTVDRRYGIWRSTDNGASWESMGLPFGSLDIVNTVEGDLGAYGRVYIGFNGSGAAYGTMP